MGYVGDIVKVISGSAKNIPDVVYVQLYPFTEEQFEEMIK